jgi:hypothetical protein
MSLLVRLSTDPGALLVRDTDDPLALAVTESTSPLALRVQESTSPLAQRVRGLFSPSQLPGLAAWYDAADSSTVLTSVGPDVPATNGQTVRRWLDKSGNGRHLDQATLANQPTLTTTGAPNGKPRITFNGAAVGFTMTSFTPTTVALAASGTGGTNIRLADSQMIVLSGTNWVLARGADGTWSGMNTTVNYNSTPACFQLTTNNASIRAGGQFFQDTATSEMPAITALPSVTTWPGGWSEVLMFSSELSDSDWLKLERYLLRRNYL